MPEAGGADVSHIQIKLVWVKTELMSRQLDVGASVPRISCVTNQLITNGYQPSDFATDRMYRSMRFLS